MFRLFLLFGFAFGLLSTHADARTFRYEFDVVDSVIDFGQLIQESYDPSDPNPTGPPADTDIGPAEYAAFVAARHPFRQYVGQAGSIVFELDSAPGRAGRLNCTSGFLCPTFPAYDLLGYDPDASFEFTAGFSSGDMWTMALTSPGTGTFSGFDDDRVFENAQWNGGHYFWINPRASFTFANLIVTEIPGAPLPVPLPATAWLLGLGILGLGVNARRRTA